jgi:aminoglycoside phosphotransferase (APT) family kinase protein
VSETAVRPPTPVQPGLADWLERELGVEGPFALERLTGGNSNETLLLRAAGRRWVVRRPPVEAISKSAHDMGREHRILVALDRTDVPAPSPVADCADPDVPGAPFLVMEAIDGHAIADELPASYPPGPETLRAVGFAAMDALAALHRAPWREIGLADFGRPDGFLGRQVGRWSGQLDRYRHRPLPYFDELAVWLEEHRPPDGEPGILHGDFHLDNLMLTPGPGIAPAAIIDWEMATIGDPLLDLGLFLGFWGTDRPAEPAMPHVQGVSRAAGSPTRAELAARYAAGCGRSVEHLDWYMALAFWKLAAIVEGAHAQYVRGLLRTPYAARLEHDVPRLLAEAAGFAGLAPQP